MVFSLFNSKNIFSLTKKTLTLQFSNNYKKISENEENQSVNLYVVCSGIFTTYVECAE